MTQALEAFQKPVRNKRRYRMVVKKPNKAGLPWGEKATGVYTITCRPNNMVYVGCTSDLYSRMCVHIARLRSGKHEVPRMLEDFRAFGEGAFAFEIVERFQSMESALRKEAELIRRYSQEKRVYNTQCVFRAAPPPKEVPPDRTVKLRQWMVDNGKTAEDLAGKLRIGASRADRIMAGELPCWSELRVIREWTKGELDTPDFYRPEYDSGKNSSLGNEAAA